MRSRTVKAERQLVESFRELARTELGTGASEESVDALAARWYQEEPRHVESGIETPMERRLRHHAKRDTGIALRKAQQPWSSLTRQS